MSPSAKKKQQEEFARSPVVIAIDPGIHGAVAFLDLRRRRHDDDWDSCFVGVYDMPTEAKKSGRNQVDANNLYSLLSSTVNGLGEADVVPVLTVIEQVSAMPGQGVSGMFSLGDSFGVARALAHTVGRVSYASPAHWKRLAGVTKNKAYSLTLARRAFPSADHHLTRKKDEGRAEALLLARFAAQNLDKFL